MIKTNRNRDFEILLSRRRTLAMLGGAGMLAATGKLDAATCVNLAGAQTEGPYWVEENLNRSDIRTDPSDGSIRPGVLLKEWTKPNAMDHSDPWRFSFGSHTIACKTWASALHWRVLLSFGLDQFFESQGRQPRKTTYDDHRNSPAPQQHCPLLASIQPLGTVGEVSH